jgi:hypothetical protein
MSLLLLLTVSGGLAAVTESMVLGGPCQVEAKEPKLEPHRYAEFQALLKKKDLNAALALAQLQVRARCSVVYWRMQLIEVLVGLGRMEEALVVLERTRGRIEEHLLAPSPALVLLFRSEVFQRSRFAQLLEKERAELKERIALARPSLNRPGPQYVVDGTCPFECCRLGKWTTVAATQLYDTPGGKLVVRLRQGETVEAMTGQSRGRPIPVRMRFADPIGFHAAEGTVVYLMQPGGEGSGKVWVDGVLHDAETMWVQQWCRVGSKECWGEFLKAEDAKAGSASAWWVQVRTQAGKSGWTREIGHFNGAMNCR